MQAQTVFSTLQTYTDIITVKLQNVGLSNEVSDINARVFMNLSFPKSLQPSTVKQNNKRINKSHKRGKKKTKKVKYWHTHDMRRQHHY